MNPKVDWFFEKEERWHDEVAKLRTIVLGCGLDEDLKWGKPCYSYQANNIVLIHVFKEYSALLFFKGVLINDAHGILIQQTKDVQVARQARFINVEEIEDQAATIKTYILEAIEIEKSGVKPTMKTTEEFDVPEEFKYKLDHIPALKAAFAALTPGRQKGYLLYFAQAKQSKTRESRIEKYIPQILAGKGLDD
jgi:uncharacterized protein YdeI (YjbR/CyaY-like superfamily)